MSTADPVPEEDHQEREEQPSRDPRTEQAHPFDQPEADLLEQELPVEDDEEAEDGHGIDAERRVSPDGDAEGFAPRDG